MSFVSKNEIVTGAIVAAGLVLMGFFGVTTALGAHPWWSFKGVYIGAIVGVVIYVLQSFWRGSFVIKRLIFAIRLLAMTATVWQGKTRFVASFAEDAFAGKMWFYGWIGIVAFLFLLVVHLISQRN
jgi:hypothetical protein